MKKLTLILISIGLSINFYSQTLDETLDYINSKQEVYKHKNNDGDEYNYLVDVNDIDGVKSLYIIEYAAIAGTTIKKNVFTSDVKNITAIEYTVDEIGRKQIIIFAKSPGFYKMDILKNNDISYKLFVDLKFLKTTEPEQIKKLIKSYIYLVKILGGKDLSIEKF